jgi:hypothetical protein
MKPALISLIVVASVVLATAAYVTWQIRLGKWWAFTDHG